MFEVGVSIGVGFFLDDGMDFELLLWVVDFVMYVVKEDGGVNFYFVF